MAPVPWCRHATARRAERLAVRAGPALVAIAGAALLASGARAAAGDADDAVRLMEAGIAAFTRAESADATGDAALARRELGAARAALVRAAGLLHALSARNDRSVDPDERLRRIAELGAACCGRPTLWRRHEIAPPLDDAR